MRVTRGNTIEELNGDMFFRGQNPPSGATLTYYLRDEASGPVSIEIRDAEGTMVRSLEGGRAAGVHRMVWDLKTNETARNEMPRRAGVTPSEWE